MSRSSLDRLERLGWRFGLASIRSLLHELGDPHLSLQCVHVAGSNGKGSTCAFVDAYLRQCGYRTGLYTSPHLCDIRERFRINGRWISETEFGLYSNRVLAACEKVGRKQGHLPTHFEALTSLAFLWFKEKKVNWAVIEVGLGGRLDATNVLVTPRVSLITPIGLEHQDILGKSIRKIAWEKAGILKSGTLATTLQDDPAAEKEIMRVARARGTKLWAANRDFYLKTLPHGLEWKGPGLEKGFRIQGVEGYQTKNAALALAGIQMLRAFGVPSNVNLVQKAFSSMSWPGRMEVLRRKPLIVMDGAHNPAGAQMLAESLDQKFPGHRWIVLNGFLKDKDYQAFARILKPLTSFSIVAEPRSERAQGGGQVVRAWEQVGVPGLWVKDGDKALDMALLKVMKRRKWGLLITGSLYLLGSCREKLLGSKGLEYLS